MAIELETENENVLVVHAEGTLTREDYAQFVPKMDQLVKEKGKIRVLFEMKDFHGWKPGAAWEDMKATYHHYGDIERLAVVGERAWHRRMTMVSKPFTRAEVRYFTQEQREEAHRWVEEKKVEAGTS